MLILVVRQEHSLGLLSSLFLLLSSINSNLFVGSLAVMASGLAKAPGTPVVVDACREGAMANSNRWPFRVTLVVGESADTALLGGLRESEGVSSPSSSCLLGLDEYDDNDAGLGLW